MKKLTGAIVLVMLASHVFAQERNQFRYFSAVENGVFVYTYTLRCRDSTVSDSLFSREHMQGPFDDSQDARAHLQQAIESAKYSGLKVRLSLGRCSEDLNPSLTVAAGRECNEKN
jgi:hypothetical protein